MNRTATTAFAYAMLFAALACQPVEAQNPREVSRILGSEPRPLAMNKAFGTRKLSSACQQAANRCILAVGGVALTCAVAMRAGGASWEADSACGLALGETANERYCKTATETCDVSTVPGQRDVTQTGVVGSTTNTTRYDKSCGAEYRISGIKIWAQNERVKKISARCTSGINVAVGSTAGTQIPEAYCGNGRLVQGADLEARATGSTLSALTVHCDDATMEPSTNTDDVTYNVTALNYTSGSGYRAPALCPEGTYAVGYSAYTKGGYITAMNFLCQGFPK